LIKGGSVKENVPPRGMKWGISVIMTLAYAFGAAYFYYLPARNEPDLEVEFWRMLLHFLLLSFLLWMVLVPERGKGKALDVLMFTVLTVPAGLLTALLFIFALTGAGIGETYGIEYFFLSIVPFVLAYKTVKGKISATPFTLALVYWAIAYVWGNPL
jgi:hypothetical protein